MLNYPLKKIVKDQDKTDEYEEELKREEEEYERLKQIKTQKEYEIERENYRIQSEYEYSDYGNLQISVKEEFQAWLLKSEFETTTEFETRIKTQTDSKYCAILKQKLDDALKRRLERFSFATIGEYNAETESYSLIYNKTDTISIKVSKNIAKEFYSAFKYKEGNRQSEIYIYPTKLAMANNYWEIVNGIIVFNNFWYGGGTTEGNLGAVKVYKKNERFFYERKDNKYNKLTHEYEPYQMTDFNSIQNFTQLPRSILFRIKSQSTKTEQNLEFKYTDLQISLPKF
ncbi:MAG: hypothetical protein IPO64_11385 [Bacteroidetes bacterium]|nr:hypothetical protein [Bacteroidota bacterium]